MQVLIKDKYKEFWMKIAVALVYYQPDNVEMDFGDVSFVTEETLNNTEEVFVIEEQFKSLVNVNDLSEEDNPYLYFMSMLGYSEPPAHITEIFLDVQSDVISFFKIGLSDYITEDSVEELLYTLFGSVYTNTLVENRDVNFLEIMNFKGAVISEYLKKRVGDFTVEEYVKLPGKIMASDFNM